tara:strand:+ start:1289 stop:2362 length:1074 start_codon:yes stop_codon:yes gene_type:complete
LELKRTVLNQAHVDHGGKLVDFSGWSLPIHYGSQIKEHLAVRHGVGIFDVSHMTIIDCKGPMVRDFLRRVLANDVGSLAINQALYSVLLNERGGVVDDLIVYRLSECYRLVTNAATKDKVLAWLELQNLEQIQIEELDLSMIAIQGPRSLQAVGRWRKAYDFESLKPFSCVLIDEVLVARTGYTGEDGFELIVPNEQVVGLWNFFANEGAVPAGLGARDTLRLEAGLNLYGQDMDEEVDPLVSNLGWTVKWEPEDRDFVGREALQLRRHELDEKLVGLVLIGKGVLRHGQRVLTDHGEGFITSGSFSPSMDCSIALARVPKMVLEKCRVEIRDKLVDAVLVKPPFVKHGKVLVEWKE